MKSDRKSALLAILLPVIILAVIVAAVCASLGGVRKSAASEDLQQVVLEGGKACQAAEHEAFLANEAVYEQQLQDEGMEFIEVNQKEFADAMVSGVLPTLTESQKALYDEIAALNPAK